MNSEPCMTSALTLQEQFSQNGYVVIRGLADEARCKKMLAVIEKSLHPLQGPAEYEADTGYPGAPENRYTSGGNTPRRLLHAYSRHKLFRNWACSEEIKKHLTALIPSTSLMLSQCHHNCIMTKYPGHSSVTHWHQDIRYWSFERPELVSVWLALDHEYAENGGLKVIPGTHRLHLDAQRLDEKLFLRTDLEENQPLLEQAKQIELQAGDVLFFHSQLMHAADKNHTDKIKASLVFTYHGQENHPTPGTRSSFYPSIEI